MEAEDEALDQSEEKVVQESNDTVVEILKCVDRKSFVVVGDAISRVIAYIISSAVTSNVIEVSEQETVLESITKASKFYLKYRNEQEKVH